MIEKKIFFFISIVVVLLMYLVPYLVLNEVEGIFTFVFWVGIAVAYLIYVAVFMRR